ncbi:hypothetical protein BCR35DRAFT_300563 [Leucosporidium creatinivorum]|uniref:Uncharacterized protein n=1 Tax=Leucosporidium creatinivorum TaxID=106004 RepID=A0A1Y2FZ42_9BASI|nr:hypothetical protein BCR35DRAFT_300563 [Leucosporidium creatinivorum]
MARDPLLELDLSFPYDSSNLKDLSSAQLAILSSSLHTKSVDPFVAAEARTLFTARRGNELGAAFVEREEVETRERATQARPRSIVRLGPEWGILATREHSDRSTSSSHSHHDAPRTRLPSPPLRTDRPAPSPPRQLAPIDLTSLSDGDDDDEIKSRHHRRRRHSRSRSPSRRRSHRRSPSRSRSPARRSRDEETGTSKRRQSRNDLSRSEPLGDEADSAGGTSKRRRRTEPSAGGEGWSLSRVAVEPNWSWESLNDEILFLQYAVNKLGDKLNVHGLCPQLPKSPELLFLPDSIPPLHTLITTNTSNTRHPPSQRGLSATKSKMLDKCLLEALEYLYANVPCSTSARMVPTQLHVAALRALDRDPHASHIHFQRYCLGLADVRRVWSRVRNDTGGSGGDEALWRVVTKRVMKLGIRAGQGADDRAILMGALQRGLADTSEREGIVKAWRAKALV